jgi:hypothetical protein
MTTITTTKNFSIVNFGNSTYFVIDSSNTAVFAGTLRRATNYVNKAESYL